MGRLTTHILDTAHGRPAGNVAVRLYAVGKARSLCTEVKTNADGRTDEALLDGDAMRTGCYELEFDIGDYFRKHDLSVSEPAFLDTVLIRFSLFADEHLHVPLLVSPWSYTTYRGS